MEILTFALVTNNTQCVTIPILNDPVIEDDEVFFLQSIDITNLTETTPQTVMITIVDDDGKFYIKHMLIMIRYQFYILVLFVNFLERNFLVTEPAVVEIQIAFLGAVSPFDVNITVEIADFTSATGKLSTLAIIIGS